MEIVNLLTEAGNMMFVLSCVFALYWCYRWGHVKDNEHSTGRLIRALGVILIAVGARIGYWAIASEMAPVGKAYHSFFVDHRHFIAVTTAAIFSWGVLLFIDSIERFRLRVLYSGFVALALLSVGIAWL